MFQKILNNKVFRYFVAAGMATAVDVVVYFITFNYILFKRDFTITDALVVSAPSIALVISFSCGLLTNFVISKYYVFTDSNIRGRHQLMRYVMVALFILMLNYFLMSFLIKGMEWYPTIARIVSALSIGVLSFVIHKVFSFKVKKEQAAGGRQQAASSRRQAAGGKQQAGGSKQQAAGGMQQAAGGKR